MLKEIYISGAVRTPIGRFGGGLSSMTAVQLGTVAVFAAARIMVTLIHEMCRRNAVNGLATLCVSGGLGGAAHLLLADNR